VSHAWRACAYDASLWRRFDLSASYRVMDDANLRLVMASSRFAELNYLSLEGCTALTSVSVETIVEFCPQIQTLLLTDCSRIDPLSVLHALSQLPRLRKLELYGLTHDTSLAEDFIRASLQYPQSPLRSHRIMRTPARTFDLGFFLLEYCAQEGLKPDGHTMAECRFNTDVAFRSRIGCWGGIKGRLVYDSCFYLRPGNFPCEILFSCKAHQSEFTQREEDAYKFCAVCNYLISANAMWSELICLVCYDREILQNKKNWIHLTSHRIEEVNITTIVSGTVRIGAIKNLPPRLKSYGVVQCR
jgi:hypothetical protein